jgi:7,8-didemethyl-8-hydroxy-5-deazariboflavin synthase CofG subunit
MTAHPHGHTDLAELMEEAARQRDIGLERAGRPSTITYSRKAFIPVTTLCRDRCSYCVFVDTPAKLRRKGLPAYLDQDHVRAIARQAEALGCREALLTLGDRPESRWPAARAWLADHGFKSTLDYVAYLSDLIRSETGLLAHLNPGVLSFGEMSALRAHAPSMGMMLESTSRRLFSEPGQVHFGSPDKDPEVRLRVLENAGRLEIPFTTGILVGIGETADDRVDALTAIRDLHRRYGHVQEVIIQNFRAKSSTAMQGRSDASTMDYLATVATARIILGPDARIQAPPNLTDLSELRLLIRAGIDDWGGVSPLTADHVNPERPWPQIDALAEVTRAEGFELRERLAVHAPYIAGRDRWIDPRLHPSVLALNRSGSAPPPKRGQRAPRPATLIDRAVEAPDSLSIDDWAFLLESVGDPLDELASAADRLRHSIIGEVLTLVVNRNVSSSLVTDPRVAAEIAVDAVDLGATELCIQGTAPDSASDDLYVELAEMVTAAAPTLHIHAFRPSDIVDGARRSGRSIHAQLQRLRDAGVDTIPGTGLKLLDETIRASSFPEDLPVPLWIDSIRAAHSIGLRSTSVIFYGHGESATDRARHLLALRDLQQVTGGFTELVPMAMPHAADDDHRSVHAVARLLLRGHIDHIQAAWTRLGAEGTVLALRSGADDLGGTLLDGNCYPEAGVEYGKEMTVERAHGVARSMGRQLRPRTTTYAIPRGATW